jgi:two-component system response regulator (stage 0 sporulation protein F)
VFEATNGQEAIEIFRQYSDEIGLVICDMVMPGMNGRETISQIRAFEKTLPAILVSAYDQSYVLKQPGEVVDFVFLSKPYGTRSLMQAIRQAFGL